MQQNHTPINSIEKALLILLAFQKERPSWGVRELSAHLGFSPSTVQRILQTLKAHNFVSQDIETRQYRLGKVYFSFLQTLQTTYPIIQTSIPFLKQLLNATGETVHLNIIDGKERLCINMLESSQALKASMPIGSRSPLYAGASSKCLLAFCDQRFQEQYINTIDPLPVTENTITDKKTLREHLHRIRQAGYAKSLGERNPGLGSLSAPVLDYQAKVLCTISLAIPEIRFKDSTHEDFCVRNLLEVAREFSKTMGFQKDTGTQGTRS
jgi:DNA-binding IclR family transcriptional regulator